MILASLRTNLPKTTDSPECQTCHSTTHGTVLSRQTSFTVCDSGVAICKTRPVSKTDPAGRQISKSLFLTHVRQTHKCTSGARRRVQDATQTTTKLPKSMHRDQSTICGASRCGLKSTQLKRILDRLQTTACFRVTFVRTRIEQAAHYGRSRFCVRQVACEIFLKSALSPREFHGHLHSDRGSHSLEIGEQTTFDPRFDGAMAPGVPRTRNKDWLQVAR